MTSLPADDVPFEGDSVVRDYIERFSNWGRWGEDDELGALNHVGPEQVVAAAGLVRQGKVISLGLPLDLNGPQTGSFRANPLNMMTATGTDYLAGKQDPLPGGFGPSKGFGFSDDVLVTPNQSGSQWDGLAHIFWKGRMYNGFDAGEVTAKGAARCGIEVMQSSAVMRGVLLDVARFRGVETLDPGYAITADELDATAEAQGVEIRTGDCLVVRTGMTETRRGRWGDYNGGPAPGLSLHTAPWLHEHDIAAIATDTWGCEVRPNEVDLFQPLHIVALVHMGIPFGEIWDLQALGEDCAADGVYEFLLAATPLPITGAAGSPMNPVAVK
ncbi:cyclase family protein [Geodermatophilus sp. YIM 151500]|uniref:cyclase family protein n=1 Tax=Geodermatophilus sp. YIM 151500 TaxID=2984531 RepID=UPI0021E42749|nr:cyclase family protein [Geodermatophilus sp. YIM 151500]MCV2488848.1 cyclase family protein [Geodermatophilus sp. YIM 151500]